MLNGVKSVEVVDGKLKVSFTPEALEKSRWAPYGQRLHVENIDKGHKRAGMGIETIKKNYNENYNDAVSGYCIGLPEIKK